MLYCRFLLHMPWVQSLYRMIPPDMINRPWIQLGHTHLLHKPWVPKMSTDIHYLRDIAYRR